MTGFVCRKTADLISCSENAVFNCNLGALCYLTMFIDCCTAVQVCKWCVPWRTTHVTKAFFTFGISYSFAVHLKMYFHLRPLDNNDLPCPDIFETHECSAALCGSLTPKWHKSTTKCEGKTEIHLLPSVRNMGGTRWRCWLRHCVTIRKVAGSISDGVIGIFHWLNPSSRTVGLGSNQPLRERSTRNVSWGAEMTFVSRLSGSLEAWTSWSRKGLSRLV